jgi:uncharacterized protein with PIN domain
MEKAHFVFHPDLPFFLSDDWMGGERDYAFERGQSLKHLIEAAGVPHTEVGEMRANSQGVDFGYPVQNGDRIEVFPAGSQRGPQPDVIRFVLDNHLGRLAAYLRMMGFDCLYRNDYQDEELAQIAADQQRILLTRDRRLLMRRVVAFGYCLRSLDSREQLVEVMKRYHLYGLTEPFRRCLRCNGHLRQVSKESVLDQLLPLTRQYYDEFFQCEACGHVFWKGSHYEYMRALIQKIF